MLGVLEVIRQIDPEMPAQTLQTLLLVAEAGEEGLMQHELGPKLGMSKAATSRNVLVLSKSKGPGLPGPGLIESEEVPENRRLRRITLTPKGERLVEKLRVLLD
jgi:DNA-binding MarR family transcriptional regulator